MRETSPFSRIAPAAARARACPSGESGTSELPTTRSPNAGAAARTSASFTGSPQRLAPARGRVLAQLADRARHVLRAEDGAPGDDHARARGGRLAHSLRVEAAVDLDPD